MTCQKEKNKLRKYSYYTVVITNHLNLKTKQNIITMRKQQKRFLILLSISVNLLIS